MGNYLGLQILKGSLKYADVFRLYPEFKEGYDAYLIKNGGAHLIPKDEDEGEEGGE